MSPKPPGWPVVRCVYLRGYFHLARGLTSYALRVNIYAECVAHKYSTRCSRLSVSRSWRQRCSLPGNPGTCLSWRGTSERRPPVFSANSKPSPKAAYCNAPRTGGVSITKPRPPPRCTRNFARCFPKRRESSLFSSPNWPDSAARLHGPLSMDRSRVARNTRKAMLTCSSLVPSN
jgi:hypothetical protein